MKKLLITILLAISYSWTANAGEVKNRLSYGVGLFSIKGVTGLGYERLFAPNQSLEINVGVDPFFGLSSSLSYNYILGDKSFSGSRCLLFFNCKKWDKLGLGIQKFSTWTYGFGEEGSTTNARRVYSVSMKDWGLFNWEMGSEFSSGFYYSWAWSYKVPFRKANPQLIEGAPNQTDLDFINSLNKPTLGFGFNIGFAF